MSDRIEGDKRSFYKAPPGHLIRTKTVQTWFLRVCFSQFVLVKLVIIKRICLYCKDLQSKCWPRPSCFLLRRYRMLSFYSPQKKGRFIKWQFQVGIFPNPLLQKTAVYKQFSFLILTWGAGPNKKWVPPPGWRQFISDIKDKRGVEPKVFLPQPFTINKTSKIASTLLCTWAM